VTTYFDSKREAQIGDFVLTPGGIRGTVIGIAGTFVTVRAVGISVETGETVDVKFEHEYPISQCIYKGPSEAESVKSPRNS
jgi:preprotein translocase subunit YajC